MTTIPVERELLERVADHLEWDGSEPMTTIQYAYKCDGLAAELRALLAEQPQARCDCAEGKCQQWFLASDEVGEECRAVYPTHGG